MNLRHPQLWLDYLLPAGQQKFPLPQVAQILSADDGSAPVTVKSIRNGMQEGRLFGNLIAFRSEVGKEQRIPHGFMTRADVQQALLATRTAPPADQLRRLFEICDRLPAEAQDELMKHLAALRSRRPIAGGLFAGR